MSGQVQVPPDQADSLNAVRDPGFEFGEVKISPNLSLKVFANGSSVL